MRYSDYTPPQAPAVIIDGRVTPANANAVAALAMNAMLLATGQKPERSI